MRAFWNFVTNDWYLASADVRHVGGVHLARRLAISPQPKAADTDLNVFLPAFQDRLAREGVEGGLRYCREAQAPSRGSFTSPAWRPRSLGPPRCRVSAMANVIELEILPELNALLPLILAIAKIATMVGLLGTVISMIGTFTTIQELSNSKSGEVAGQAGAIGLALFATALGLVIAIPLVFTHVLFKAWIVSFDVKLKNAAQKLLTLVQATKPTATGPAPTSSVPPAKSGEALSSRK